VACAINEKSNSVKDGCESVYDDECVRFEGLDDCEGDGGSVGCVWAVVGGIEKCMLRSGVELCSFYLSENGCLREREDCDVFVDGGCDGKVLFDGECETVGKRVCLNIARCEWDIERGCVVTESNKESQSSSSSSALLPIVVICMFYNYCFILFKRN
jgi:hypothetical protein